MFFTFYPKDSFSANLISPHVEYAYAFPSPHGGEGQVENPARGGGEGNSIVSRMVGQAPVGCLTNLLSSLSPWGRGLG